MKGGLMSIVAACLIAHLDASGQALGRPTQDMRHRIGDSVFDPGSPVVSYVELKRKLEQFDRDEAAKDARYQAALQRASGTPETGRSSAPAPARAGAESSAPPSDAAPLPDADLQSPEFKARVAGGDPAAIAALMQRARALRAQAFPGLPTEAPRPASTTAPPTDALMRAMGGGAMGEAFTRALKMQSNPEAGRAIASVEREPSEKLPFKYDDAWEIVRNFEIPGQRRTGSIYVQFNEGRGLNLVDPSNPLYRDRLMSYEDAVAFNLRQGSEKVPNPSRPSATGIAYRLGSVDLNTTALIKRAIDKSKGFSYVDDYFTYLKPVFASDAARELYERSINQPMDPAYYATHRWSIDFDRTIGTRRSEIDALPTVDQAQLLGNLLLWVRYALGESGVLSFLQQYPQIQGIEFIWMRPRYVEQGGYLTSRGEISRGDVYQFLRSPVQAGTPDQQKGYPFLADSIPAQNLDVLKRSIQKAQ